MNWNDWDYWFVAVKRVRPAAELALAAGLTSYMIVSYEFLTAMYCMCSLVCVPVVVILEGLRGEPFAWRCRQSLSQRCR
jgi:hypothetical protein